MNVKASHLMEGQSRQAKTVLKRKDPRNKTFPAFKDSPGNPLGRSPTTFGSWSG